MALAERRVTRQIDVGGVAVGGDAPISVQSMTTTKTADHEATLQQIYALAGAGCDIVRCTCNETEAAEGLARLVPRSPMPVVADIHFQYKLALAALEAGVHQLRLNPGNIRKPDQIRAVAEAARDRGISTRIGVNAGSLDPELEAKYGRNNPVAMVESAKKEIGYFEDVGYDLIEISVKSSNPAVMIEAYRLLADVTDHPLHLGVTEAGPMPQGLVKATAGIATLLAEGIGDTIRYSLTADPVEEAKAGRILLESFGLRERRGLDLIACPSCGRAEIDVIDVASRAQTALEGLNLPDAGRGDGVRGERTGGGGLGRPRDRRRPQAGPPVHRRQGREGRARGRHGGRAGEAGRRARPSTARRPPWPPPTPTPPSRPRPTVRRCWPTRAPTPTPASSASRSSAGPSPADRWHTHDRFG